MKCRMAGVDLGCATQHRLLHFLPFRRPRPLDMNADFQYRRVEFPAEVIAVRRVQDGLITDMEMKHLESWHEWRCCCAFAITFARRNGT
jgi:hypothetical protein